mgnify:CR=1 FL=1
MRKFQTFLDRVPQLNQKSLEQTPKLIKFICVNNSLESISNNYKDMSIESPIDYPRKKATSTTQNKQKNKKNSE